MKKRTARWLLVLTGLVILFLITPFAVNAITWGHISPTPRANYLDGLGTIAGWFGQENTEEKLSNKAYLIRNDLVEVALKFRTEEEATALTEEAFRLVPKISSFGQMTRQDGGGEVRYDVPRKQKEEFRRDLLEFRGQFRDKQNAQQDAVE